MRGWGSEVSGGNKVGWDASMTWTALTELDTSPLPVSLWLW